MTDTNETAKSIKRIMIERMAKERGIYYSNELSDEQLKKIIRAADLKEAEGMQKTHFNSTLKIYI
jgi:hypothetical protein